MSINEYIGLNARDYIEHYGSILFIIFEIQCNFGNMNGLNTTL